MDCEPLTMTVCSYPTTGATEEECKEAGCIWDPSDCDVPSCFFPPNSVHGYTLTSIDNSSTAGTTVALLELKNTSASIVPNMKKSLRLEVTEYSSQILRVKVRRKIMMKFIAAPSILGSCGPSSRY